MDSLLHLELTNDKMKERHHNQNDIKEAAKQRLFVAKQFEMTTQQQLKFANIALERAQFRVRDTQEVHKMAQRSLEEAVKFARWWKEDAKKRKKKMSKRKILLTIRRRRLTRRAKEVGKMIHPINKTFNKENEED